LRAPRLHGARYRLGLAVAALTIVAASAAGSAAASPSWTYDCNVDSTGNSLAVCERLTYLAGFAQEDADRMQLVWVGVWLLAGIALVGLIAGQWHRTWDWFRVRG